MRMVEASSMVNRVIVMSEVLRFHLAVRPASSCNSIR